MEESSLFGYAITAAALIALAVLRAYLHRGRRLEGVFGFLGHIEVGFLGILLLTLVVLGGLQVVLRNIFHGGLLWADPLMRHIVLWIGCLGAAMATTRVRHINIDVFSRMMPAGMNAWRRSIVYFATAVMTFLLGVSSWRLVLDEKDFGDMAFASVPVWVLQLVLPVAFFLVSYRSLVNLLIGRDAEPLEGEVAE